MPYAHAIILHGVEVDNLLQFIYPIVADGCVKSCPRLVNGLFVGLELLVFVYRKSLPLRFRGKLADQCYQ